MLIGTCFQTEKEGEPGIDDAAGFFAHVFGGDAFEPYVRLIAPTCAYRRNETHICRSARFRS
jgi:hypothetical protein